MPGLSQAVLNYGRGAAIGLSGLGERAALGAGRFVRAAMSNPYANRTALGAIGGAVAGGMYADSGNRLRGALVGAGIGAAGARYGGAFMRTGMTPGMSLRGAGLATAAVGRRDFRMAMRQGRAASSLIGNSITQGYSRIRGLFR